ncbi:thymidine kinase [Candidatus Phytoplasma aurantifolia]|uniref:Thymidine kinase n=2 Tax=Candidatus Phytoplasma citri TaxID=180978 RepID=A0ABU8ZRF6_9MOLU|nr:thymidine kinase [Candidatus Phytoplasma aurantifolia]MDO8060042.1 thymidine kinase [Candidatus Phytoplasma aurantifolia]MDO8078786.1 thymidine kinase [Candidatus Phytoplasma aurantifolia]
MMVVDEEGFIEVICGPMFSGKTTELIKRINLLKSLQLQFLVFKPFIDNRYSFKSELINHNLERAPAILIGQSQEIFNFMKPGIDFIIIDEAQFLDSDIEKIVNDLSYQGIRIIIAGLELDFRGRPFGSMPYLLSIADRVTKYRSYCFICGKEASRTQRIYSNLKNKFSIEKEPIILIGGKDYHEPCCRKCHKFKF